VFGFVNVVDIYWEERRWYPTLKFFNAFNCNDNFDYRNNQRTERIYKEFETIS
jgi:hypothetical protein